MKISIKNLFFFIILIVILVIFLSIVFGFENIMRFIGIDKVEFIQRMFNYGN